MTEIRRFTRRKKGKVLLGLCAGLGEYFGIDPILIRLAFLLGFFALTTGLALIVFYVIASLVVPYGDTVQSPERGSRRAQRRFLEHQERMAEQDRERQGEE